MEIVGLLRLLGNAKCNFILICNTSKSSCIKQLFLILTHTQKKIKLKNIDLIKLKIHNSNFSKYFSAVTRSLLCLQGGVFIQT